MSAALPPPSAHTGLVRTCQLNESVGFLLQNVMAIKYPQSQGQTSAISSAALAGAIIGQLTFGSLADRLGRKAIFVSTIAIVIVGALGSATVVESSVINIYTQLTLWLLLLGLGIGGEYPLSEYPVQSLSRYNQPSRPSNSP